MGKINVLDFEIANLIAAGEVVERPASVVKELIENALDAGATKIVAEIKRGGVSLIRVSDNGCGMDKEDLPVCLKRHATSKIKDRDDLAAIMTLGFRGEALAAISAVSTVTIITKTRASNTAYMLSSRPGESPELCEVGAADGTTVAVEELFSNVPARRKFLKKDSTEAMNVAALVEHVALSSPGVSIQFLVDGEEKFRTPGDGDLSHAVYAVLGRDFLAKSLTVEGDFDGIRVHGIIGRSDNTRKNRNLENFFVNNRYVRSLTAGAALEKAYTSYIAPECFPACVLFVDIAPGAVDVNVHPSKMEIKFSDERAVFEAVYYSVKDALERAEYRPEFSDSPAPAAPKRSFIPLEEKRTAEQINAFGTVSTPPAVPNPQRDEPRVFTPHQAPAYPSHRDDVLTVAAPKSGEELSPKESIALLEALKRLRTEAITRVSPVTPATAAPKPVTAAPEPAQPAEPSPEYRYVGEAFDCYVMVEYEGDLLVIDKHAAHERVIFEELKKNQAKDGRVASQMLLLPLEAALTPDETAAAEEHADELSEVGFAFVTEKGKCEITAIPDAISALDATDLFVQMCDELAKGKGDPAVTESVRRERALYQIACKAAIKGGRTYDRSVIDWLVKKLLSTPDITVCPHGRPVAYRITKRELDRKFDRIK